VPPLTNDNVERAREIISRYPSSRSALLPLLYLAQEQDGWVTEDAMRHIGELLDITPAEVFGTCSFYTMFKREPVGRHLISVCTNIACLLNGGYELLEHAEQTLGIVTDATTADGEFTLEEVECLADCDRAPCLQVNYRFFGNVSNDDFNRLVDDLKAGRLSETVPAHGVLNREQAPPVAIRHADTPHGTT
jgi:NADH-quinone oxidoreductase E subunit